MASNRQRRLIEISTMNADEEWSLQRITHTESYMAALGSTLSKMEASGLLHKTSAEWSEAREVLNAHASEESAHFIVPSVALTIDKEQSIQRQLQNIFFFEFWSGVQSEISTFGYDDVPADGMKLTDDDFQEIGMSTFEVMRRTLFFFDQLRKGDELESQSPCIYVSALESFSTMCNLLEMTYSEQSFEDGHARYDVRGHGGLEFSFIVPEFDNPLMAQGIDFTLIVGEKAVHGTLNTIGDFSDLVIAPILSEAFQAGEVPRRSVTSLFSRLEFYKENADMPHDEFARKFEVFAGQPRPDILGKSQRGPGLS